MKKVYEAIARGVARMSGKKPDALIADDPALPSVSVPPEHHIHMPEANPPPAPVPGRAMTPLPSKAKLLKLLRQGFGPTARFQTMSDGRVEIWAKVAGISDAPIVEVKARDPKGEPAIYWMATCAAFRSLGFALEHYPDRIEVVPYREGDPKHKNSEVLDA